MRSYKGPSDIRHILIGSPKRAEFVQNRNKGIQKYWDRQEPNEQLAIKKTPKKNWNKTPRLNTEDKRRISPVMTRAIEAARHSKLNKLKKEGIANTTAGITANEGTDGLNVEPAVNGEIVSGVSS